MALYTESEIKKALEKAGVQVGDVVIYSDRSWGFVVQVDPQVVSILIGGGSSEVWPTYFGRLKLDEDGKGLSFEDFNDPPNKLDSRAMYFKAILYNPIGDIIQDMKEAIRAQEQYYEITPRTVEMRICIERLEHSVREFLKEKKKSNPVKKSLKRAAPHPRNPRCTD